MSHFVVFYENWKSSHFALVCDFLLFAPKIYNNNMNIGDRRADSLFCLFKQSRGFDNAGYSAVKIEKLNNELNIFEEVAEIALGDRILFDVILHENKLYVLGGEVNDVPLKSFSSFDLKTREEEVLPEMHSPRSCSTSILFEKYIFVFGGYNGTDAINSCERFDTETKTWITIKSMNFAHADAYVTIFNKSICVAGGWANGINITSVELYDLQYDDWLQLASMKKRRYAFAFIKLNDFLYAMGGGDDIVERYSWNGYWAEIGSFNESRLITSGINIDGQLLVMMTNGKFGRIKIDGTGKVSFAQVNRLKYESYPAQLLLCKN